MKDLLKQEDIEKLKRIAEQTNDETLCKSVKEKLEILKDKKHVKK